MNTLVQHKLYPSSEVLDVIRRIKELLQKRHNDVKPPTSSQVIEQAVQFVVDKEIDSGFIIDWDAIWSEWSTLIGQNFSCSNKDQESRSQMLLLLPQSTYDHLKRLQQQIKDFGDKKTPRSRSHAYLPYTVRMVCRAYLWCLCSGTDSIPMSMRLLDRDIFKLPSDCAANQRTKESPSINPSQIKAATRDIYSLIYRAYPDIDSEKADDLFTKIVESASILSN